MSRFARIGRRRFLGGAGALVALPWLASAMWRSRPAYAQDGSPRRFIAYYTPNGFNMSALLPAQTGVDYELTDSLSPLAPHRDSLLLLSGMDNRPGRASPEMGGLHAAATGAFLSGVAVAATSDQVMNGVTLDQQIAQLSEGQTRLRSLELGLEGGTSGGGCDGNYGCAYSRNIAWASATQPLPKLTDARVAFDRLVGGLDPTESAQVQQARIAHRRSVLDFVLDDASALQSGLDADDRRKLDDYLGSVRQLELGLQALEGGVSCDPGVAPGAPLDGTAHARLMSDIMVMALRCDHTRVISFMMGNANSERSFPELGIDEAHHDLSHHGNDPDKLAKLQRIDRWQMEQLAYLINGLASVSEAEGSLLDSTALMFSSEVSDGDSHSIAGIPVILAGGAGGAFRGGRHLAYTNTSRSELYVSILQAMGSSASSFGTDGYGPLASLA